MKMALHSYVCVLISVTLVTFALGVVEFDDVKQGGVRSCLYTPTPCGICGPTISVTLRFRNSLKPPFFDKTITVPRQPQRELFHFLQRAADVTGEIVFTISYSPMVGYILDSINGQYGSESDNSFWDFLSENGSYDCGVSVYVPKNGETITFNFTNYKNAGYILKK
ncbi:cobalamin binding intrinsic factor-like isoform X3 [Biomphalaria glabrata]|uniref:Cobalamin binding intrinsic factor-like isoform X3 n=1 Tax=Biomphalaria glabrata TaxID=6526 RepID=A0A9W2ZFD7_BIOGL|nr:cobalamin binding intrinsic factor-like isoform X3 [Biomphalaria glabrata]